MKVVAFIFARGGSKGLPGKNIRSLGGKPLIAWSIEHASGPVTHVPLLFLRPRGRLGRHFSFISRELI